MKFGFVTCVQLGLSCMEAIYQAGGHLDLALTLEDSRSAQKAGRVYLDDFCRQRSIPLLKICHINDASVVAAIRSHQLDWLFIIGWSQIASAEVLASSCCGVLGMHPTLLPEGRGRAAIPWAILKRLPRTGVTLFRLAEGVDTGPVVAQKEIRLSPASDASWLYNQVTAAHSELMFEVMPALMTGLLVPMPQDENRATIWPGRKPDDGRIDVTGSVHDAECLVRAVTRPYPGAFFEIEGRRTIIWKARVVPYRTTFPGFLFNDGYLEFLDYKASGT